jgi:hypothetical protein
MPRYVHLFAKYCSYTRNNQLNHESLPEIPAALRPISSGAFGSGLVSVRIATQSRE